MVWSTFRRTPLKDSWRFCPSPHPLIQAVPAFSDNYIWLVRGPSGNSAFVVDPGDAAPVEAALDREGLRLSAILLTHHHPDHVGGVARLRARGEVRVFGPPGEDIDDIDTHVSEGDAFVVPGVDMALKVIDVPGHTRGHIAYYCDRFGSDDRPVLFSGDTLFAGGCGRIFEGTPEQMHASLAKLAVLPGETLVHCAHEYTLSNLRFAAAVEPRCDTVAQRLAEAEAVRAAGLPTVPSNIMAELQTNPFLRCRVEAVVAAAASRLGRAPVTEVECFAAIREWKNVFR